MRIVAIGDIGILDDMIHIGDEAMFEEFVEQARKRGVDEIVAISANPVDSSARYGTAAVNRIGFTGARSAMAERMAAVLSAAGGVVDALAADDRAWAVIEAIRTSDGVAITGGGNMSSLWPMHIFERATIGEIARLLQKPLVVSGQTIGPDLEPDDAALVRRLLTSSRLVGLRERASFELCRTLGVPQELLTATIDDASFLGIDDPASTGSDSPYCLVTLASHVGDADRALFVARVASLLDAVAATGLAIVFSPHFGSLRGDSRGDSVMHDRVRASMTAGSSEIAARDATTSAQLARNASLVVSSRYHPAVFAVSAGVPTIGIPVDEYTTVKLTGALGNFGQSSVLSAHDLLEGRGTEVAADTWARRREIAAEGEAVAQNRRSESATWWDTVLGAFGSAPE